MGQAGPVGPAGPQKKRSNTWILGPVVVALALLVVGGLVLTQSGLFGGGTANPTPTAVAAKPAVGSTATTVAAQPAVTPAPAVTTAPAVTPTTAQAAVKPAEKPVEKPVEKPTVPPATNTPAPPPTPDPMQRVRVEQRALWVTYQLHSA
jgi:outer membrane biosynthesis protein TonB